MNRSQAGLHTETSDRYWHRATSVGMAWLALMLEASLDALLKLG